MKRLLCIVSSMNMGGAETFLMKIYRKIDKEAYQFDFVVNEDGVYDNEIKEMGGFIYKIPMHSVSLLKAFIGLSQIVRKHGYKYVLKMSSTPIGVFDIIAAKTGGAKYTVMRSCNSASEESTIKLIINRALRPLLNRCVDIEIAPSKLAAEYTFGKRQVCMEKVKIIHNAIEFTKYKYDEKKRLQVRAELDIEDKMVIGHIGRFSQQKNHEFLIDIFKAVLERKENAVLLLVGQGKLVSVVKEKVKNLGLTDKVQFLGVKTEIQGLLSAMDVMVLPSFYEGMPNVVIEAQAAGLPCVISDSITREANLIGKVYYVSLDANPAVWADKILQVKDFADRKKDYSIEMRKKGYDIECEAKKFLQLLFEKEI